MRSFILLCLFTSLALAGCRKPNAAYRDPCTDSLYILLSSRVDSLTPMERDKLISLDRECKEFAVAEENRGKLWPYILGGVAVLAGAIIVILSLVLEDQDVFT